MPNPKAQDPALTVAVAPTATTLITLDTSATQTATIQVTNLDAVQTLACTIQRRAISSLGFADTTMPDLANIGPLATAAVDIDCGSNLEVRVIGTASGAGLDCTVGARDKPRRP